jgi:curved DNA-binding protein CbpA
VPEDWQTHWEDYYKILQVDPSAEPEVIAAAYKKLTAKYHPDHNPSPDANEKTKRINVAYSILSDPEKRKVYDAAWLQKKSRPSASSTPKPRPPKSRPPKPVVEPQHIRLHDVDPRQIQTFSIYYTKHGWRLSET